MEGYCMILVVNDLSKYDDILKRMFDMGLGATSLDSMGMGKFLLENDISIPFFGTIRQMVEGNRPYNKTVISVVKDKEKLDKAVSMIKEELGIEHQTGMGFLFVLPVIECYGLDQNS